LTFFGPESTTDTSEIPIESRRKIIKAEFDAAFPHSKVAEDLLGMSRQTVSNYRKQGKLLGVKRGRDYLYPSWQFGEDGQPVDGLERVLHELEPLGASPTELLSLIIRKRPFYNRVYPRTARG